jgi:hypothetical protein
MVFEGGSRLKQSIDSRVERDATVILEIVKQGEKDLQEGRFLPKRKPSTVSARVFSLTL